MAGGGTLEREAAAVSDEARAHEQVRAQLRRERRSRRSWVAGSVSSVGAVTGDGFTVTKGAAGIYTINFVPRLPVVPHVVAMCSALSLVRTAVRNGLPTRDGVEIRVFDGAGALVDCAFSFVAML